MTLANEQLSIEPLASARAWRWTLTGAALPVEFTVDLAHAILAALNQTAAELFGSHMLPPDLHPSRVKREVRGRERHRHGFILPLNSGDRTGLDACVVASPAALGGHGFSRRGLAVLAACERVWIAGVADVRLAPAVAADGPPGLDGPARVWRSATPFLPGHRRADPQTQLVACLTELGLPWPARVDCLGGMPPGGSGAYASAFRPRGPARARWDEKFAGREGAMAYWRIAFEQPVEGPIVIGGLCHFGLGRFAPEP